LLEAVGSLLIIALLIEADAFDVGRLRLHIAAATRDGDVHEQNRANPAVG
jgi:hypothetical protein